MNRQTSIPAPMNQSVLPLGGSEQEGSGPAFDLSAALRSVWSAVYRNRWLILAIVAAAMMLGVVATLLAKPKYQASATVQIDQQSTRVLSSEDAEPVAAWQDADRFLQTQVDVLQSRSLALRVAQSLNLGASDAFITRMGYKLPEAQLGTLDKEASKREMIIWILRQNMKVNLPQSSRIAQIQFRSPDPVLAAQIANSYANNFILSNLRRRLDASAYARDFLQQQLVQAKQRLEESERAMLAYAKQANLIDASEGLGTGGTADQRGPRSLVTSDLVQLNTAQAQATAERIQAQQRWEQARSTRLLDLPEVLANPAVIQLTQLRAQAQAAYDQDRTRRKPDYPSMVQLSAQIAGYDAQIREIAGAIRNSIRDRYLTALRQQTALGSGVQALKQATMAEQEKSVRYNILKRETDTNRTMYDGLLQRFKEVSAAAGISASNISLIDAADPPATPVYPKPLLNLAASGLLGLILAGIVVLIREKVDDAVRSPDDVSRKLGLTCLNSIPLLRAGETPHEELLDPRSAFSEAYAATRTSLELVDPNGMPRSLLFTSSRQSEGKSTSAYAIARDFAKLGRRVVLIDGDLRKPSLHRALGLPNTRGFSSVLARHKSLDEALQPTETPNLTLLSSGPLPPNPAELLSGATLHETMNELGMRFDLVVLDGPPVLGLADAIVLSHQVGGVVFVIEANGSHHGHAKAAIRRLQGNGALLIGALLTKFDARKTGYGSSYGYYYYSYGADRLSAEPTA